MENKKRFRIPLFLAGFLLFMPSVARAITSTVDCNAGQKIGQKIKTASPGDLILVSGVCSENIVVPESKANITIDGQGTATIGPVDPAKATIMIRGGGITIRNFSSITGGHSGITVIRGGSATIVNNIIEFVSSPDGGNGILVTEGSNAAIGFVPGTTGTMGNAIQNNSNHGILVSRVSSVQVKGNLIEANGRSGVTISRVSQADVESNTINSNIEHGIFVTQNSGVNIASNNSTVPNNGNGLRCRSNSYVEGPLTALTGALLNEDMGTSGCVRVNP